MELEEEQYKVLRPGKRTMCLKLSSGMGLVGEGRQGHIVLGTVDYGGGGRFTLSALKACKQRKTW
jgi:hypothetical protein